MDKTERQDQTIISLEQAKVTKTVVQTDPAEYQATLRRYLDDIVSSQSSPFFSTAARVCCSCCIQDYLHRKLDEMKQMHATAWAQQQVSCMCLETHLLPLSSLLSPLSSLLSPLSSLLSPLFSLLSFSPLSPLSSLFPRLGACQFLVG
jgi:hypothetical protein